MLFEAYHSQLSMQQLSPAACRQWQTQTRAGSSPTVSSTTGHINSIAINWGEDKHC